MSTDTTTSNTSNSNATEGMLRLMVEDENWTGIVQLLKERDSTKTEAFFVFGLLTARPSEYFDALIIDLLKDRYIEEAVELISTLIALGGQELVMRTFGFGSWSNSTLLHAVCRYNQSIDLVSQIIEVGGEGLVLAKNNYGKTSLHFALWYNASTELVLKLIEVGGEELVLVKGNYGYTSLHDALRYNASNDVVLKLIEVGGKKLVLAKDNCGDTALHTAVEYQASNDVLLKLIEVGGEGLVVAKDNDGDTSLHIALEPALSTRNEIDDDSIATINHLIRHGGAEFLNQRNNEGMTPLESIITKEIDEDDWDEDEDENGRQTCFANCIRVASLLIKNGIDLKVEGEYDIGGLLSTSSSAEIKEKIYNKWDSIVLPALEQVMSETHNRQLPVLQGLILHKVPTNIFQSTMENLCHSITNPDSFGRYPIDFGAQHGLAWNKGMKEILEGSNPDIVERMETSTGLYPFMVAALGGKENGYDFDTVFHMIKSSPKLISHFGTVNTSARNSSI